MKIFKKILLLTLILNSVNYSYAQDAEKTVTLVVSGQGKTQDVAKQNALRSAIEQAFGAFISSKTEILNNNLVKDEIVSVSNGNIQRYEVISQIQEPEGVYATTIKATVSITKLTSFIENKGYEIEFKGLLFSANLRQQYLNEDSEFKSIKNLSIVSNAILSKSLNYLIELGEPHKATYRVNFKIIKDGYYYVPIKIITSTNENYEKFIEYFVNTINSIKMNETEIDNYKKIGKRVYTLKMHNPYNYQIQSLSFRSAKSAIALQNLFIKSNRYIHDFNVLNNIDTIKIETCCIYRGYKTTNNIESGIYLGDIGYNRWCLNYTEYENNMKSFPDFSFYHGIRSGDYEFPAWKFYYNILHSLTNQSILFEQKNYFNQTIDDWFKYGNPYDNRSAHEPYRYYPAEYIEDFGVLKFTKNEYFSYYYALYSEVELSKVTSFSVKKIF